MATAEQSREQGVVSDEQAQASGPTDLPAGAWKDVLKRAYAEFKDDNATDWAATLTYYGIQSMFPAILALFSIVGLAGKGATNSLIDNLRQITPGPAKQIVTNAIDNLSSSSGSSIVLLVVGFLGALWSASGYVGAFTRASNGIWEVEEGRPFYKLKPMQLAVTFVMLVLLAASALAVVLTGGLATQVGNVIGVGDTAVTVWDIAKWPVLVLVVSAMLAILYWATPNAQQPKFRWVSPGGLAGVLIWIVASGLFALYVANFSSYNKTYGSLGAVIAFLVWLWITNLAVIFGAEINAELARERQMAAGQPEAQEPITPPRDTTKMDAEQIAALTPADAAPQPALTPRPPGHVPDSGEGTIKVRTAPAEANGHGGDDQTREKLIIAGLAAGIAFLAGRGSR